MAQLLSADASANASPSAFTLFARQQLLGNRTRLECGGIGFHRGRSNFGVLHEYAGQTYKRGCKSQKSSGENFRKMQDGSDILAGSKVCWKKDAVEKLGTFLRLY